MKNLQQYLLPLICVGISVAVVLLLINPSLTKLKDVKAQIVSLEQSEARVNELIAVYDTIREGYQKISDVDKQVLEKALPSNINNVRLILEIENISKAKGLALKDIDVALKDTSDQQNQGAANTLRKVVATATFSGDYSAFVRFLADIEKSLRIIAIRNIDFKVTRGDSKRADQYEYKVELETYWFVYDAASPSPSTS